MNRVTQAYVDAAGRVVIKQVYDKGTDDDELMRAAQGAIRAIANGEEFEGRALEKAAYTLEGGQLIVTMTYAPRRAHGCPKCGYAMSEHLCPE